MNVSHLRRFTARGKRAQLVLVLATICSAVSCSAFVLETDVYERVKIPSHPTVELHVHVGRGRDSEAARYWTTARATLQAYADRFGVMPFTSLTVTDSTSPSLSTPPSSGPEPVVVAQSPWLAPRLAMEPELAVTRAVGAEFWRKALSCDADGGWFVDGLNQYTATPVVASQFPVQQTPAAYAYAEGRYFSGLIPWVGRVPLRNATAGNGLEDYRSNPKVDVRRPVLEAGDRRSAAAKTALAMATLERWVGAPTWDAVLGAFASRRWTRCPSPADLEQVARDVTGLDLSWFFSQVFGSAAQFDYGIETLASEESDGTYRTTVTVRRYGDAEFTGNSAPRSGPFESGRGMSIRIVFEDGSERLDFWDGRDRSKPFTYESASPARFATVDPEAILLLDVNRTNNSRMRTPATGQAAGRWAARWTLWVQDLLLTWASLA